jgi:two-component system cell cycle sensor histidine kinase/response regulator CckA
MAADTAGKDLRSRQEGPSNEVLHRRHALADAVLENSSLGIVLADRAGRILRANTRLAQMFGYEAGELDGQTLEILLPERLRALHAEHRAAFFAEPRVRPMGLGLELSARRKDGREFPVEISLSFVRSHEGLLALGFVTDITPRRNAERQLQAEFAVTRVFAAPGSIEDLPPRLLQALCESLAWDVGELWRPDGDGLRYDAGWHRPGLDTHDFEAVSRDTLLSRGTGLAGKAWEAGRARWMPEPPLVSPRAAAMARLGVRSGCAFPIHAERALTGVMVLLGLDAREPDDALLVMLTDIGHRIGQHLKHRRAEGELRHQREVMYQSEKLSALGRLVAGVAHEMNNPLGIISSRIELMLGEAEGQDFPAQHLEDLKVIHRNVLRVAGVAQALRSFARQSTGERHPVDLNAVVTETLLLVGKPMSTDNVRITTSLDLALPPILGDANALQQVLLNLLANAREAMSGGGEIRVETGPDPARSGRLRLTVTDTGPGIPATYLPHIFEPFYTTKPSGTGLGLAVSYGIVQDHQGTIDVRSAPGDGATFTLGFPVLEDPAGSA